MSSFVGRVGLFRNQSGDFLLESADVVIIIGFDPVEYDAEAWNAEKNLKIIHLDTNDADVGRYYRPKYYELVGDIASSVMQLSHLLQPGSIKNPELILSLRNDLDAGIKKRLQLSGFPIHPLCFIADLQSILDDNTTVISDVGSHYMWLARHLYCYHPHCNYGSSGVNI